MPISIQDYSFHRGGPADGELAGRWWWTLYLQGWMEAESSCADFDTEQEARDDAERHLSAELA